MIRITFLFLERMRQKYYDPSKLVFRRTTLVALCRSVSLCLAATLAPILWQPAIAQTLLRDAEIEEWLRDYSDPLIAAAGIEPSSINILLIGDPTLNAFAGGRIMGFHTGLLTQSQTPNEIEAVIAHEVGHIAGGHTARSDEVMAKASRPMLLSLVLAAGAAVAGAPEASIGLLGLGQNIGFAEVTKYSRGQEAAADQASLTYLEKTKRSGKGAIDIWNRMRNAQIIRGFKINPYRQTHPMAIERAAALQERVEASPYYDVKDSPEDMHRLHMIQAKIIGFLETPQMALRQYPESDTSEPARYARAVAYYRDAQIDKALVEIDSLIEAHPDNQYFHELKGQMLFEFGRVRDSIAPHRDSVELDPDEALLRLNLGRALVSSEDPTQIENAIKELRAAVLIEPDNAYAWFFLSRAYGFEGNLPMAHLATAESKYHGGAPGEAAVFAQRAIAGLSKGTPEYRQAADIIQAAQNMRGRRRTR
ncbi:MAG: M48 family metalloprotease [Pseudomonadota bacterium]